MKIRGSILATVKDIWLVSVIGSNSEKTVISLSAVLSQDISLICMGERSSACFHYGFKDSQVRDFLFIDNREPDLKRPVFLFAEGHWSFIPILCGSPVSGSILQMENAACVLRK